METFQALWIVFYFSDVPCQSSPVLRPLLGLLQVVNKPDSHGGGLDWTKICEKSSKVITFIDLAGHEKYLKTTVFGMTGHLPDFCMLMVSGGGVILRLHCGEYKLRLILKTTLWCPPPPSGGQ